jgi:hypothetical protein
MIFKKNGNSTENDNQGSDTEREIAKRSARHVGASHTSVLSYNS